MSTSVFRSLSVALALGTAMSLVLIGCGTSEKKNELLLNRYLTPGHNFTSVHFWDDDAKNLDAFMNLTNREDAQHLRDLKLQAYRVKHDGSTEVWNNEAKKRFDEQLQKKTQETAENLDVPALPQEPKQ